LPLDYLGIRNSGLIIIVIKLGAEVRTQNFCFGVKGARMVLTPIIHPFPLSFSQIDIVLGVGGSGWG
jgi:hypothetical protein